MTLLSTYLKLVTNPTEFTIGGARCSRAKAGPRRRYRWSISLSSDARLLRCDGYNLYPHIHLRIRSEPSRDRSGPRACRGLTDSRLEEVIGGPSSSGKYPIDMDSGWCRRLIRVNVFGNWGGDGSITLHIANLFQDIRTLAGMHYYQVFGSSYYRSSF